MSKNTDHQNQMSLRNFDLTEYRNIINDLAIQIYQNLVRIIDSKLQPMIGWLYKIADLTGFIFFYKWPSDIFLKINSIIFVLAFDCSNENIIRSLLVFDLTAKMQFPPNFLVEMVFHG